MQIFDDYGDKRQYFDSLGGLALGKRAAPHVRFGVVLQGYSGPHRSPFRTSVLERESLSFPLPQQEWTFHTLWTHERPLQSSHGGLLSDPRVLSAIDAHYARPSKRLIIDRIAGGGDYLL